MLVGACAWDISLTMSYFHTGIRTIIGAEVFHGPVRDGKGWDHLAMVIRLELVALLPFWQQSQFNRVYQLIDCVAVLGQQLECSSLTAGVKVIGSSRTGN